MDVVAWSRLQFALTTIYHFFFVPLTLGLSIFIALLETRYVRSGDEKYKHLAKFWGTIFLINFALGVVTGLVQEFQFGLNWSEYSRFMGDIFGAPLAIEALLAFYMESTFIGVWVFGWERISRRMHLAAAWLVALGSNISALWILIANSFMQNPVGYTLDPQSGYARMSSFLALVTNPNVFYQYAHVFTAGLATAGFVVMGFSAWHLLRRHEVEFFGTAFRWAARFALIGSLLVIGVGHFQGQFVVKHQPMKMAAAEALWETQEPAALALIAFPDEARRTNTFAIEVPYLLSFLSYNNFTGRVQGINELEQAYQAQYGPGSYVPPVTLLFWSFRIMVGAGFLMALLAFLAVIWSGKLERKPLLARILLWAPLLPYLASTTGWILAEVGRWPWIVYRLLRIEDAVSPNVPAGNVAFSLIVLTLLYLILAVVGVSLALKYGTRRAITSEDPQLVYAA